MEKKNIYTIKTKSGSFKVKIWLDKKDAAFLVKGLTLPDVVTFGRTLSKAKKMAKEALELYCDCLLEENKVIIDDERRVIGKLPKSHIFSLPR